MRSHRRRCAALLVAATLLTGGCAAAPSDSPGASATPEAVVEILQLRGDVATGHIELRVTNHAEAPLTILRATYASTRWSAPMTTENPATIPPGLRRNLRLQLPEATCDAGPLEHRAELELADGTVLELLPGDPEQQLEALDDRACDLQRFASTVAQISWLEPSIPADGAGPAIVRLRIDPIGIDPTGVAATAQASGSLDAIDATVLLTPVDAAGMRVEQLPVGLQIRPGDAPTDVAIPLEPGRCDLHAIAEDKQGTLFRLRASIDGEPIDLVLPSPDAQRDALLDWVVDRCAARP
ncbi:hypothetical protein [Agrococcus sp. ProA11]|uniref:hypothetical protein n=1 Tax=Agrococcus chionoecetis TaxID=3153752 RepID=UPI003261B653